MNPHNGEGGYALKSDEGHDQGHEGWRRPKGPRRDERSERRALLMRIANGQYSWPELPTSKIGEREESGELRGVELVRSEGVRRVVGRLLVRDPKKRAKVAQLWEDEWMNGEGAPPAPVLPEGPAVPLQTADMTDAAKSSLETSVSDAWDVDDDDVWDEDFEDGEFDDAEEDEEVGEEEDGVLVDEHDIAGSVACQELLPP